MLNDFIELDNKLGKLYKEEKFEAYTDSLCDFLMTTNINFNTLGIVDSFYFNCLIFVAIQLHDKQKLIEAIKIGNNMTLKCLIEPLSNIRE
ncbi:MAG: hypothetical protein NC037_01575 [Bacteroides sp.]|nr:hypothetical protein [Bacillota bacterium]MCM1455204.1 hypothetical protein [Bacteroides sp.]